MSKAQEIQDAAQEALNSDEVLKETVEALAGSSRRSRQQAASVLAQIAKQEPRKIAPFGGDLVDALNRPESQTRWEALDALTSIVPYDSRVCDKAIPGAETALFDEDSGPVRLAAMRFLCTLGATTENRSEKTWPLIEEGIRCYHGDLEFQDMLLAVLDYSSGKLSANVKSSLADRMRFDAENSRGTLRKRAQAILENVSA